MISYKIIMIIISNIYLTQYLVELCTTALGKTTKSKTK